ncbi:hypothetical protein [Escherichia coli]|uniref:hypothetical protein n=1 Tax=Escherichia coli TaxID=562 RepID=UPI002852E9EC|nr:hypothetical protein [Escherichia coli]
MGEISVKTGNNARNGGKNSLNRLIRCVCGKKIGPDPRNFNQRVSLGRNDLLIRTFHNAQPLFDELFRMQSELATMLYKYEYKPGKRIQDLIYHLDRDDLYSRKYWHKKFSDGLAWPE